MTRKNKYYCFLLFFMTGFILGILYANFIGTKYVMTTGVFHEFFLEQYVNQKIEPEQYFLYLLKQRTVPLIVMGIAGMTRFRKMAGGFCLLWTGFAGGMLAVAAVLRMGIAGMLFFIAALFPQVLFYIFAYIIVINYLLGKEEIKWNGWKMGTVVLMMSGGIIMETYVNPKIVKWMLEIFSIMR